MRIIPNPPPRCISPGEYGCPPPERGARQPAFPVPQHFFQSSAKYDYAEKLIIGPKV